MFECRAQTTTEVIAIAVVIAGLLVLIIATVVQKNTQIELISTANKNYTQCNALSEKITRMHNSRATSRETVSITEDVNIQKSNGIGSIEVGGTYCIYVGSVAGELDPNGFALEKNKKYCFEKQGQEVTIVEGEC